MIKQLKSVNCKAKLIIPRSEISESGMNPAKIILNLSHSNLDQTMSVEIDPLLETMLFSTRDQDAKPADQFLAYIRGNQLIVDSNRPNDQTKRLVISCKIQTSMIGQQI